MFEIAARQHHLPHREGIKGVVFDVGFFCRIRRAGQDMDLVAELPQLPGQPQQVELRAAAELRQETMDDLQDAHRGDS